MITYEEFKEIIVNYIRFAKCERTLNKLKIDIFESPLFEVPGLLLDRAFDAYFTDEGHDTICWWMFEYHDLEEEFDNNGEYIGDPDKEPGMWTEHNEVIPMITIKDLWNEVKDERREFVKTAEEKLSEVVSDMIEAHLKSAVKPIDIQVIKEATKEWWKEIKQYFRNTDNLVEVDNSDEATADIMSTYLEDKAPYRVYECERCNVYLYLDSKVGTLMVLSDDDYEMYVWQG
jgi:hypothetical protein